MGETILSPDQQRMPPAVKNSCSSCATSVGSTDGSAVLTAVTNQSYQTAAAYGRVERIGLGGRGEDEGVGLRWVRRFLGEARADLNRNKL